MRVENKNIGEEEITKLNPDSPDQPIKFEHLNLILHGIPTAIVIINENGTIVFANEYSEKIFGYKINELLGNSIEILVPTGLRKGHIQKRKAYKKNPLTKEMGKGRDLYAVRKDGTEFPVEIGLNPIVSDQSTLFISSIIDITLRKDTEKLLEESSKRVKEIMDNTTDAILVFDDEGVIETLNREAENLYCSAGDEELTSIWDIIPSENKEIYGEQLQKVKEGSKVTDFETEKQGLDGRRIPISLSLNYVESPSGKFIETNRNIQERIETRNKFIELEKSQVIGKMAEGFAHHMGTPLASMLLRVQMLEEDLVNIPEASQFIQKLNSIENQILYGQRVIQRLLKFVSKPVNEQMPHILSVLLDESIDIIKPILDKKGIDLITDFKEGVRVSADTNLFHLMLSDTIMNAIDAMPDGGTITVQSALSADRDTVEIRIEDTGTGIAEDIIPFVFEPFFTTKSSGKGTGLGLSVAKRIIHEHGGQIRLESKEGKGTTVIIVLPTLDGEKN